MSRRQGGFTLIEMLVVAAIIVVVTTIVFAGQSNFNGVVILNSTAYDIALTARNAETYGLGTRGAGITTNAGYGLDFKKGSPTSYTFFADTSPLAGPPPGPCHPVPSINGVSNPTAPNAYPGDCVYNASGYPDTTVATYQLGNGMIISNFCGTNTAGISCSASCGGKPNCSTGLTQLDIVYLRPNSQPFMSAAGVYNPVAPITSACVTVAAPKGTYRYIAFSAAGQIDANVTSCP